MKMDMKTFSNYVLVLKGGVLLFKNNSRDKTWQRVNKIINNKS